MINKTEVSLFKTMGFYQIYCNQLILSQINFLPFLNVIGVIAEFLIAIMSLFWNRRPSVTQLDNPLKQHQNRYDIPTCLFTTVFFREQVILVPKAHVSFGQRLKREAINKAVELWERKWERCAGPLRRRQRECVCAKRQTPVPHDQTEPS